MAKSIEISESPIFDVGISAQELTARKTAVARVLNQVKKALDSAENSGKSVLAAQLQAKADRLQELLDHADDLLDNIETDDSSVVDNEDTDSEDTAKSGSDEDKPEDSEKEIEKDGKEDNTEDSVEGGDKESTEDPDTDSIDRTGGDVEEDEESDLPEEDDTSETEKEPEKTGSKNSKSSDKSKPDKSETSITDNEDDDDSEEAEESSESGETDSDPDEDTSEDEADSDDKALINPFTRPPLGAKPVTPAKNREVESVFDAAKRILSKLDGEARRGAVQGLKDLLLKKGEYVESLKTPLKEAITKTIAQMSEDEFNDELSSAMELVDKAIDIDYSDDLDKRVAEIKRDAASSISRMELEKEDADYIKTNKTAMKAFERENDKYKNIKALRGLEAFQATLYKAVSDQVEQAEDEVDSWAALDRRHEDDPSIIKKGRILDDGDESIPSINVYFDQSGSWNYRDIEIGKRAISVINEFHERGEIKLNIFYMSAAGVFTTAAPARADGRAEGWYEALQHIKSSKAKNVIILSDSDLDSYEWNNRPTGDNGRTIVDGCVWWLWKDSSVSKKALKELVGRRGNFQYQFAGA